MPPEDVRRRAPTLAELDGMSDDELRAHHDAVAPQTGVWLSYYLDEWNRRQLARQTAVMVRLTSVVTALTAVNLVAVVWEVSR